MDIEEKIDLACRPPTVEVVTRDELRSLFESSARPRHYTGFEASGLLHIGSLFIAGYKIRDLQRAGCDCTVFLADWHTAINKKLGGDLEKIRACCAYYKEAFEFFCPGVKTVLGSELYAGKKEYWEDVIRFSKEVTLARSVRCLTIMGRSEKEKLDLAQYFYPPMQAVDIHALDADVAHAGMDQRRVHVLAREVFPKLGWRKPIALHHALLPGLAKLEEKGGAKSDRSDSGEKEIAGKMSKSKPWTCIFVHDSREQIKAKLEKAFCPPRVVEANPVLEIARQIVFRECKGFVVEREAKFGGRTEFASFDELSSAFKKGWVHPADLKLAVASALDEAIAPVRKHFENKKHLLKVFESES